MDYTAAFKHSPNPVTKLMNSCKTNQHERAHRTIKFAVGVSLEKFVDL